VRLTYPRHIADRDLASDQKSQKDRNPLGNGSVTSNPIAHGALIVTEQFGRLLLSEAKLVEGGT